MTGVVALVLAGSRGPQDPLAVAAGVSHKAFVPVAGTEMLVRVVETLRRSLPVARIVVAIERPELVHGHPRLADLVGCGALSVMTAGPSPATTVGLALEQLGTPLLVTTADHPLLTPEMVEHFWTAVPQDCDVAVGLARAEVIRAAYPQSRRTYLRFKGLALSGCNLFALRAAAARGVVDFWRRIEAERKRPHRMIALLGIGPLLRFAIGQLTLRAALKKLGRLTGATLAWVDMPQAEAAMDVDKPDDLVQATAVLRQREAERPGS
jgi:GTP:adenosylcobinamide-phosphate guanylyltransferase